MQGTDYKDKIFPDNEADYQGVEIRKGIGLLKESRVELYVVRHGQSESNEKKILNTPDENLTELGKTQAFSLGFKFAAEGLRFDVVFASPLRRAFNTSDEIAKVLGVEEVIVHKLLEERHFETMAGVSYADIPKWAEEVGPGNLIVPSPGHNYILSGHGIEELSDLRMRAGQFLAMLGHNIDEVKGENNRIMLVSHGDISHMLISNWIGEEDFFTILKNYRMPNAGGYILQGNRKPRQIANPLVEA